MPRAECYYDILGVEETATSDEIKKAYRSLALTWHPDKNQANKEEAHIKFQSILKAYETLSDSRERDWYDRHKDQILSDGNGGEEGSLLNLFQYFSSSCYAAFDDSEDGFYTVYRKVFETIAEEEGHARKQTSKLSKKEQSKYEEIYPSFGNSKSDYEETVRRFYAYWEGFCTSINFDHLDKYNTTEAENRRIMRAMEKENKKVKEAAKKERNTNVRNLVEFVKKRDKRLKAHKLIVEQQIQANRKKTAEKQKQQRERLLKETTEYKPTKFENMDDIEEQLRLLEEEYDEDHDYKKRRRNRKAVESSSDSEHEEDIVDDQDDDTCDRESEDVQDPEDKPDGSDISENQDGQSDDDDEEPVFFCAACHKEFTSINAFTNHESSKKHKKSVMKMKKLLEEEGNKAPTGS